MCEKIYFNRRKLRLDTILLSCFWTNRFMIQYNKQKVNVINWKWFEFGLFYYMQSGQTKNGRKKKSGRNQLILFFTFCFKIIKSKQWGKSKNIEGETTKLFRYIFTVLKRIFTKVSLKIFVYFSQGSNSVFGNKLGCKKITSAI